MSAPGNTKQAQEMNSLPDGRKRHAVAKLQAGARRAGTRRNTYDGCLRLAAAITQLPEEVIFARLLAKSDSQLSDQFAHA